MESSHWRRSYLGNWKLSRSTLSGFSQFYPRYLHLSVSLHLSNLGMRFFLRGVGRDTLGVQILKTSFIVKYHVKKREWKVEIKSSNDMNIWSSCNFQTKSNLSTKFYRHILHVMLNKSLVEALEEKWQKSHEMTCPLIGSFERIQ